MLRAILLFIFCLLCGSCHLPTAHGLKCKLPPSLQKEIQGYQTFVNQLIAETTKGKYSGRFYDDLAQFVDKFGNRLAGTKNLERSIEFIANNLKKDNFKVSLEPVKVPYWVRGNESAYMVSPRMKELKMLGLGYSPGTGSQGITADVVVVSDFDELQRKSQEVKGKIVLFNYIYTNYSATVKYRMKGPSSASRLGAVAALVRSVTPFSIYSPHTGTTWFGQKDKKIPAAAITLEDADMMARLSKAGYKLTVQLKMDAKSEPDQISHNLLADIRGSALPNHYVTVSGHIDSWDVGQGALDDGVGAFLALHSVRLLHFVKAPSPKRTIRTILWTAEEEGLIGAEGYLEKHKDELKNWTAAMESDTGLYKPMGLNFHGNEEASCILQEIVSLFKLLNATTLERTSSAGSDITVFKPYGVPLIDPYTDEKNYMWYHHSDGDSMRVLNSSYMDSNLAIFAGTAYILANLSIPLPRAEPSPWIVTKT